MNVYIIMTSNCEAYEDYYESIDSVWSTREAAIKHIENDLDMEQVNWKDPEKDWTRDRWEKEFPFYPQKEEYKDDPEGWKECFDENGDLIPYYSEYQDAWIVEMPLNEKVD